MKRLFNVWLVFLSGILLATMFMSWLIGTNQGASFVVDKVIRSIPAKVQTGSVNGKLAGGLEIEGITVRFQTLEVSAKRLYLRWNPLHLLGGWIGIREIAIDELSINDLSPEVKSPYDLTWPQTAGVLSWIKARIMLLNVALQGGGAGIIPNRDTPGPTYMVSWRIEREIVACERTPWGGGGDARRKLYKSEVFCKFPDQA
jgi:hypothetical protein